MGGDQREAERVGDGAPRRRAVARECRAGRDPNWSPLDFDKAAIEEAGLTVDEPVSLELANVSAATALRRILRPYDLTTIIDGEVLVVTTHARAEQHLTTHVYPVADLAVAAKGGDVTPGTQSLMQTIQQSTTVLGSTSTGPAERCRRTIYGGVVALAVRQTDDVHRQVESILYQLRQARSPAAQKALEIAPW